MSHLPVNHSSVSWRPPLDEGNRTTSSEESRHEILMPSKWKTMSIKITNRVDDEKQHWWSQHPMGNKISQWLSRDRHTL